MSPHTVYKKENVKISVLGFYADTVTVTVLELNKSEG